MRQFYKKTKENNKVSINEEMSNMFSTVRQQSYMKAVQNTAAMQEAKKKENEFYAKHHISRTLTNTVDFDNLNDFITDLHAKDSKKSHYSIHRIDE